MRKPTFCIGKNKHAVSAQLICAFVFTCACCLFSYAAAQMSVLEHLTHDQELGRRQWVEP